jgi:hypothetical protein
MTLDEEGKFIQNIMTNHDTAMAAAAESTTHTGSSKGMLVDREVDDADFISSGG